MTDYYASTAIADGSTGAGTSAGAPTSIRHAYEVLANAAGDRIFFQNAGSPWTLQVASGSLNSAAAGSATASAPVEVIGYTSTIGDQGMPIIVASGGIDELILADDAWTSWSNVILDGGTRAIHSNGTSTSNGIAFYRVWCRNQSSSCVDTAGHTNEPFVFMNCAFTDSPIGLEIGGRDAVAIGCVAINCSTAGFQVANNNKGAKLVRCAAHSCGIGFQLGSQEAWLDHCVANENTTGVSIAGAGRYVFTNCGITNNGTGVSGSSVFARFYHVGTYGNATTLSGVTLQADIGRVTTDPLFYDGSPADPLTVDLSLQEGSGWRSTGIQAADFLGVMEGGDIGLTFPTNPPGIIATKYVPIPQPARGI